MLFEHDCFIQVKWESVKIGESLQIAGQMFKFTRRQCLRSTIIVDLRQMKRGKFSTISSHLGHNRL